MAETPETVTEPTPPQTTDPVGRLREAFGRLSNQQKIVLAVAIAAIVGILVGAYLWSRQPDYKVLFSNISDRDGAAIIAALEQSAVPYRLAENGSAILVPSERVYDVRLRLAGQGLPRGGSVGFELLENQKFGVSQFAEQVNYQRALEGELGRSIESLSAVESARVHLGFPKPSIFQREKLKPTASVVLHLLPGRMLDISQVAGISHLIASSVPDLPLANVTIVDQNGELLSQLKDKQQEDRLNPNQLKYAQEFESGIIKRISDILTPMFGTNNYRVQVAADLDFALIERTSRIYGPNTLPRSRQTAETVKLEPLRPQGDVPGSLTNQPPVPAEAPLTQPPVGGAPGGPAPGLPAPTTLPSPGRIVNAGADLPVRNPVSPPLGTSRDITENNEVDETISHIRETPGSTRRLTAAVVVNYRTETDAKTNKEIPTPLTDTEIAQITNLVRDAMGYDAKRGDSVSVVSVPFAPVAAAVEEAPPFWKNPENIAPGLELAKYLLLASLIFILYWIMIRPVFRTMFPPPPKPEVRKKDETETEGDAATGETGEGVEEEEPIDPFEKKLQEAREFAQADPKAVAHIIEDWLNPG